jgi:hypothetical protein
MAGGIQLVVAETAGLLARFPDMSPWARSIASGKAVA